MSGYGAFSAHYDALTRNVDYAARARYFSGLFQRFARCPVHIVLDLACGTGSLTLELAALGYEMIGTDSSMDMLSQATAKAAAGESAAPLFLCQSMTGLDLYGTIEACVCALDSLNHLPDERTLRAALARVSLFLQPGGVFVFDVNTAYKHREILADNAFVYDLDEVYCVWQNGYHAGDDSVDIALDFFVPQRRGEYRRSGERFRERIFSHETILDALNASGLRFAAVYDEDSTLPPHEHSQRLVYVATKPVQ